MVKNIIIDNIDEYVEDVVLDLIKYGINYCLIKNDLYYELHVDNIIYRFFDFNKVLINKMNYEILNQNNLNNHTKNKNNSNRPGYKRYTKKDIKRGNIKNTYKKR